MYKYCVFAVYKYCYYRLMNGNGSGDIFRNHDTRKQRILTFGGEWHQERISSLDLRFAFFSDSQMMTKTIKFLATEEIRIY